MASETPAGLVGNGSSHDGRISADGNRVVFESDATNLDATDANSSTDVFMKDLPSGALSTLSSNGSATGNGPSGSPDISASGQYVTFWTAASDIAPTGRSIEPGQLQFADLLSDAGIPAHMAHPGGTKAITSARVKNDAVDAKTLAHLLRTNLLPEAWMAPPHIRGARRLVRSRVSLTRIRSRLKYQVHVISADYRLSSPVSDLFGVGGRAFLESLDLPESIEPSSCSWFFGPPELPRCP